MTAKATVPLDAALRQFQGRTDGVGVPCASETRAGRRYWDPEASPEQKQIAANRCLDCPIFTACSAYAATQPALGQVVAGRVLAMTAAQVRKAQADALRGSAAPLLTDAQIAEIREAPAEFTDGELAYLLDLNPALVTRWRTAAQVCS